MEYGCIGEHLGHSFSKEIHNSLENYDYTLKELALSELKLFMEERNFKAINVTIPYKLAVIPYLHYISPEAKAINAVNTIVNKDGKLYGYNTDFYGLKGLIEKENVSLKGKTVLILGSGGTSNTAFAVAQAMGAKSVFKVSRNEKDGYITYNKCYDIADEVQIIINTTPCGMFPATGVSAIDIKCFSNLEAVFDAVYNPLKSQLIIDAQSRGIKAVGGLYMLVLQAACAVEHFTNKSVDYSKAEDVFQKLYKSKMNIVLIGMPGCGKSTIGEMLSKKLNKVFKDTDELIVKSENTQITDIFKSKGEKVFRDIESREVALVSKENGMVIATGGGAVLNKKNTELLKGNGRVYFINRPIEQISATSDRPLSSSKEDLYKRFTERYDIYLQSADVVIDGSGTVEEVVKRIEDDYLGYTCN